MAPPRHMVTATNNYKFIPPRSYDNVIGIAIYLRSARCGQTGRQPLPKTARQSEEYHRCSWLVSRLVGRLANSSVGFHTVGGPSCHCYHIPRRRRSNAIPSVPAGFDVDFPVIFNDLDAAVAMGYKGVNFITDRVYITRWYNRATKTTVGCVRFSANCEGPPGERT